MNYLTPAQASAQLTSLIVYVAIAAWYVAPWLKSRSRADALIALLWVHIFRYVALQIFAAQQHGFPITNEGAMQIVVGDVAGALIAFVVIALLRYRIRLAIPLAWLLVAETAYDTFANIRGGIRENLMGAASDTTWFVLVFYVPMVVLSAVLIGWQLYTRRREALDLPIQHDRDTHESTAFRASSATV